MDLGFSITVGDGGKCDMLHARVLGFGLNETRAVVALYCSLIATSDRF
jgi:hypothetical protein